ncbi:uncharacterized protein A4U43_C10F5590 [Asparagus officinalis]|uniref:Methyltransferase n=1 Tax=Asparagus officinalis TaxID=4686 RepID=A0A5P1E2Q2_ASPOF|nr:uncharacterized protein A4U43_C10F5590 [Asparagus officinalis]
MPFSKGPRMDKKSSSYCSTTTIVVLVALCLVGVWMMTSSTVAPVDITPSEDNKSETTEQVTVDFSRTSEDSGDTTVDNTSGDSNSNSEETEKSEETTQEESPATDSNDNKNDSDESQTSNNEGGDTNTESGETNGPDNNSEQNSEGNVNGEESVKTDENQDKGEEQKSEENQTGNQAKEEVFPDGAQSEILKETDTSNGAWKTQAAESKNENEVQQSSSKVQNAEYNWKLCNTEAGADYIPCLDNVEAIKKLHLTGHYEHRERHCPEEGPTCLVPLPEGYKKPIQWPNSRDKIWYHNVPHTKLAEVKGHQNWVKVTGEYLTFPGGGMLLLELNRLLRPGGYFVWSATPVYRSDQENVEIWKAMTALTKQMCWEMVKKTKDSLNQVGLAIYRKPTDNKCYEARSKNSPPLCQESDDPSAAWNVSLQACIHKVPEDPSVRGSQWPEQWPERLGKAPYWLSTSQTGVYGKPAIEDFEADYEHWKHVVSKSYLNGMGIDWSTVRNVMDMRAIYGGFAAALRDMQVWVMNVVSIDAPDTLPVIFERGLFGIYHDWCESFSTYPRTYDLLHADHLFSKLKTRCKLLSVIAEVDRVLRPEGKLIIRDDVETINDVENMAKSLHWEIRMTYAKDNEGLLCIEKKMWRPQEIEGSK